MSQKKKTSQENAILAWAAPELTPTKRILLFGLVALIGLGVALFSGILSDDGSDTFLYVFFCILLLVYAFLTVQVIFSYRAARNSWRKLSGPQQKELRILLQEQIIHYRHMVPASEFLCLYSKNKPAVIFFSDIGWIYTLRGKLPNSATTFTPEDFKATEEDNYIILHTWDGKKYTSYSGNETLPFYSYIVESTPQAVHGFGEEKRQQYKEQASRR